MKTITVNLTCKSCNNTFAHTKSVKGDGKAYIFWAKSNVTQCPRCYAEEKMKERMEWTLQYLSDNCINLPELTGTPGQIKYAEKLRNEFVEKYYLDIVDAVDKYMRNLYIFEAEAAEKDIRPGQAALLKWEGTRDYFLFASVYIQSAGFLIDMFLGDDIERVVA